MFKDQFKNKTLFLTWLFNVLLTDFWRKLSILGGQLSIENRHLFLKVLYSKSLKIFSFSSFQTLDRQKRDAILSISGAYPSTNNSKLLDLFGLLEREDWIQIAD